jgi:hypothetical protein
MRLVDAQRLEEKVVGPQWIEPIADAVARRAAELGECIVWPVGVAAERVAGVVTARTRGAVAVGTWNMPVEGQRVLLFAVAAVTPLDVEAAADRLRRRGAVEVHACAVQICTTGAGEILESFTELGTTQTSRSLALLGAA